MRRVITIVIAAVIAAVSFTMTGLDLSASAATWSCSAHDSGSQNPGPGCPKSGAYHVPYVTNSSGGDNTYVINDFWNTNNGAADHHAGPETVYVNSPASWQVDSKQPKGNTAVNSYPDVQDTMTTNADLPRPVAPIKDLFSDFKVTQPATSAPGDFEAAYDLWLGRSEATAYQQEVMVWVDNHGQVPAGSVIGSWSIAGQKWQVWRDNGGEGGSANPLVSFVLNGAKFGGETSGRVNILSFYQFLQAHKLTTETGINQADFGWELCSDGGVTQHFLVSNYDLKMDCRTGGTGCYSS